MEVDNFPMPTKEPFNSDSISQITTFESYAERGLFRTREMTTSNEFNVV